MCLIGLCAVMWLRVTKAWALLLHKFGCEFQFCDLLTVSLILGDC